MTDQPFLASFCNGFTHHFSLEKSGDEGGGDAREGNGCFLFWAMLGSVGGRIKFHHLGTGAVEKKEDDELDMH